MSGPALITAGLLMLIDVRLAAGFMIGVGMFALLVAK